MLQSLKFIGPLMILSFAWLVQPKVEGPKNIIIFRFDSASGTEFVQFFSSGRKSTSWVAIGFEGRVCSTGRIPLSIEEVGSQLQENNSDTHLEGIEVILVGGTTERVPISRAVIESFFRQDTMRSVIQELKRTTKKADRIRYICDVVSLGATERASDQTNSGHTLPPNGKDEG